jgi:hypothetical protein
VQEEGEAAGEVEAAREPPPGGHVEPGPSPTGGPRAQLRDGAPERRGVGHGAVAHGPELLDGRPYLARLPRARVEPRAAVSGIEGERARGDREGYRSSRTLTRPSPLRDPALGNAPDLHCLGTTRRRRTRARWGWWGSGRTRPLRGWGGRRCEIAVALASTSATAPRPWRSHPGHGARVHLRHRARCRAQDPVPRRQARARQCSRAQAHATRSSPLPRPPPRSCGSTEFINSRWLDRS